MVAKYSNKGSGEKVYFVGIGLSMGANLMMKIAGEQKESFPLDAMVSFNNPFDVWLAINLMRGSPYEKYLARELRKNLIIRDN
jgi:predicted alpha/beta-fold hydrolase